MTSREFLETSCEILFKAMNISIEKTSSGVIEKRSATIANYLKESNEKPYSNIIYNIFMTRFEYHLYPERYGKESSENQVNVFMNKSICLLSTLFGLNFSFLRTGDLENDKTMILLCVGMVAREFSIYYVKDRDYFVGFFMEYLLPNMHNSDRFTQEELDKFLYTYSHIRSIVQENQHYLMSSTIYNTYKLTLDFLRECYNFFVCLLNYENYNSEIENAANKIYEVNKKLYKKFYHTEFLKSTWKEYETDFISVSWKSEIVDLVFKDFSSQQNVSIFDCANIFYYIFGIKPDYSEVIEILNKFNSLEISYKTPTYDNYKFYITELEKQKSGKKNDLKNAEMIVQKNAFIFYHSVYYKDISSKLHKINSYINIKRRMYFCMGIDMSGEKIIQDY